MVIVKGGEKRMSELMLAEEREALSLRVTDARTQSVPQSLVVEDTLPDEHPPWLAKLDARAKKELVDIVDELVRLRQQPERRWFISSAFTRWREFMRRMRRNEIALCVRTVVKYLIAQVHQRVKEDCYFLARRIKVLRSFKHEIEHEYIRARTTLEQQSLGTKEKEGVKVLLQTYVYRELKRRVSFSDLGDAQEPTAQIKVERFVTIAELEAHIGRMSDRLNHLDDHIHLSGRKFERSLAEQLKEFKCLQNMAQALEEIIDGHAKARAS